MNRNMSDTDRIGQLANVAKLVGQKEQQTWRRQMAAQEAWPGGRQLARLP